MIDINELRQLTRRYVGTTAWSPTSPQELIELLDRLEVAEKERDSYKFAFSEYSEKQSGCSEALTTGQFPRNIWAGTDVMSDLLSAAEKERDALCAKISDLTINVEYLSNLKQSYEEWIGELQDGRDALRAKIVAMERQEPVAWCTTDETGTFVEALGMNQSRRFDTALYLAPGAQGEEK